MLAVYITCLLKIWTFRVRCASLNLQVLTLVLKDNFNAPLVGDNALVVERYIFRFNLFNLSADEKKCLYLIPN